MRLDYLSSPPPGHEARFKAAVYDRFEENSWRRSRDGFDPLRRTPGGGFDLAAVPVSEISPRFANMACLPPFPVAG